MQIGFNAGHSAAVFLASNPDANLFVFDLFELPYSKRSRELFRQLYKDRYRYSEKEDVLISKSPMFTLCLPFPPFFIRFHSVKGYSQDTLPWFIATQSKDGPVCDLFSVDGIHDHDGTQIDIINAIRLTKTGGVVIIDDTSDR